MKNVPKLPKKIIKFIILNASDPIVSTSWDIGFTKMKCTFLSGKERQLSEFDIKTLNKNGFPPRYWSKDDD